MSSKMLAGLVAGGFGAALSVGLDLSASFSPQLAYSLALALLFGLGILSGVLAASWLDLADYGHQTSAGAFAGLIAAGVTELTDLILRLVFASISSTSPTSIFASLLSSRLPTSSDAARVLLMVLVNLLLYLVYLLILVGISGSAASFAGRAKSAEVLQAMLAEQEQAFPPDADEPRGVDPALLPFMSPAYSPFVSDEPPLPRPTTRPRRPEPGDLFAEGQPERRVDRTSRPLNQRGQPPPGRNLSGGLRPPGPPVRGTTPGSAPRRPTSGLRPPPNAQWPKPRDKE
jgi:hypothetical protein